MKVLILGAILSVFGSVSWAQTPSPAGSEVYFIEPKDGVEISGPVQVILGLRGMGVAPALLEWPNTGHHHILVNSTNPAAGIPIAKDEQHIHLGGGQTETNLDLPAGEYTLQLVLGDHNHVPHDPPVMSEIIKIKVR